MIPSNKKFCYKECRFKPGIQQGLLHNISGLLV